MRYYDRMRTTVRPTHSDPQLITMAQLEAVFALFLTHATVLDGIDRALQKRYDITFSAFEILSRLKDEEPQSVRSLADRLVSVSPTRASRLVQDLVDAGHLQRGADQGDGRRSLISFTAEGRRYAKEVCQVFEEAVQTHFIDHLDADDVAALTRIWDKLAATKTP